MNDVLRGIAVVAVALGGGLARPLPAQWGLTLDVQRNAFGGTSKDTTSSGPGGSFRPGNTPALTLRVDRRLGRVALGVGVRYSRSAVVLNARDLYIGLRGEFTTLETVPEIRVRLARTSHGAALHCYGGPVIGVWTFEDFGARVVTGAVVGVAGEIPIFDRLAFSLRVGGGLTHSIFRDGELPPELVIGTTSRSEIALGLRYGH